MVRTSANPKKRRRTSGLPIAVPKDVASIRLLIDTVARTNELPLPGVDSVHVRKGLFERENTWPRGKRVEAWTRSTGPDGWSPLSSTRGKRTWSASRGGWGLMSPP